jgi:hypothetical protein
VHSTDDRPAGVADDGVEAAEPLDGRGDPQPDARSRADVERDVAAVEVADDDGRALLEETIGDGGTDP